MDQIIEVVSKVTETRNEEDIVDRLNYKFTAYLFCFGSLLITSKLYLGTPIKCWAPAEFKGGWVEYTHDYCLVENTYYIPMNDAHMPDTTAREDAKLPYYQWVQFVLVLLAFGFYIPHLFWRSVNWQSGVQVRSIVNESTKFSLDETTRTAQVNKVARHIERAVKNSRHGVANKSNPIMLLFGYFGNSYLAYMYILTKVFFLLMTTAVMCILHIFLGFSPMNFFHLKLGFNTNWKETGLFPRSTMCDFEIRTKGNIQRYSVQCVLQLNMFNEKIFVVLYYWLVILFAATLANLAYWCFQLSSTESRRDFAKKMLKGAGISQPHPRPYQRRHKGSDAQDSVELKEINKEENNEANELNAYADFTDLSPDQVLLLRLISSNAGDIAASDVTAALFRNAVEERRGNH